jgi:hypothetical protein
MPVVGAAGSANRRILVLFDGRIEDGRRFAAAATFAGQAVHDTGRDLARLLYREHREWASDPQAILAGVTRYADYQVAAGIAREQGRSVVAAFAREQEGGVRHLAAGSPARLLELGDGLSRIGFSPAQLDRLVLEAGSVAWICA